MTTLTDIWNEGFQKQASVYNMQKVAEDQLEKMAVVAGYDFMENLYNQEKQSSAILGEIYAEGIIRGFEKAAELDGVFIPQDVPTKGPNNVPSQLKNTLNPVSPVAGQQGWNMLQNGVPAKGVGQVTNPQAFRPGLAQVGVPGANRPVTTI